MKNIITISFLLCFNFSLYAQDYPQWPADKPETGFIEQSQSRETRLGNDILPQEINMQDKMRITITDMMENAAKRLGWQMVELSEYTNIGGLQSGSTPYNLRSPRGIDITFQFIANKDSLQAWKNYQTAYDKQHLDKGMDDYGNIGATTESPLYKKYKDSADYYINLYTTYVEKHKDEGAALFTTDKHPKYYQKKETEFIDKMTAMTDQTHENSGIESMEDEHEKITQSYRNSTVVQVQFKVNPFVGNAIDQALGPIESTSIVYPLSNTTLSKLYTIKKEQDNPYLFKWTHSILILIGNFKTIPVDKYMYPSGFYHNGQGDEHTLKKIKSDKVQDISISIFGNKANIERMAKLVDTGKLNGIIVKN